MRASLLSSALAGLFALCPRAATWTPATQEAWPGLRGALEAQRASRPGAPWAAGLRVTMHDPITGRVVEGRGAIAVSPDAAVRMILVAGAGATVLDAWVTPTRWRVAVPPLDLVRRGDADEPRDMPVGFLRWWFLTPLSGMLFAAEPDDGGTLWLLREGRAVVELRDGPCARGRSLHATRRLQGHAETVDECREASAPRAGDTARYVDEGSGLHVEVVFESVAARPPDPEAFRDPDAPGLPSPGEIAP